MNRREQPTVRDLQRETTRRRLYEAALEVFRRDGAAAARIDEIARLAGVSRAAFYFHFPTKDDVLRELLESTQAQISAGLLHLPDDTPLAEVLVATARAIARTWRDDPVLLRDIGTVALRITAQGLPRSPYEHAVHRALVPRFRAAHARGEVDALIPPELMTEFFLVNLFGAALAWCAEPSIDLELVLTNVVAFFLRAALPE